MAPFSVTRMTRNPDFNGRDYSKLRNRSRGCHCDICITVVCCCVNCWKHKLWLYRVAPGATTNRYIFRKAVALSYKIEICASCIQKNACLECHKLTWTRPTLSDVILTLSICIADPYSQTEGALAFIIRSCRRDRKKEHGVKYRTNNRSLKMNVNYGAYRMLFL